MFTAARMQMAIAGLFGASGTALWASATHAAGGGSAAIGAQMLLIHAAAIIALVAARHAGLLHERFATVLTFGLALGVALFAVDLALRGLAGTKLFAFASPLGGVLIIISWLGLAIAAFVKPRR